MQPDQILEDCLRTADVALQFVLAAKPALKPAAKAAARKPADKAPKSKAAPKRRGGRGTLLSPLHAWVPK